MPRQQHPLPPIGSVHGYLTVIGHQGRVGLVQRVLCRCRCGNEPSVRADLLRRGKTKSCGCLKRELLESRPPSIKRHPLFRAWKSMRDRVCYDDAYIRRGITICPEWASGRAASFYAFLDYVGRELGERPPGHTLDRINNDRGYEPGNIRWATRTTQQRNRSYNRIITVDGVSHCITEWAEISGIPSTVIFDRLRRGWSERLAVSLSKQRQGRPSAR